MSFTVLIPARLASTRLPNKPLADIGGIPMVVRVAQRVLSLTTANGKVRVVVAADSPAIILACQQHGIEAVLTRTDHPSGSDRLAEACHVLGLAENEIVINVQGDEPLIDPALVGNVAQLLADRPQASMSTAAHVIDNLADFSNPNVVKVVLDAQGMALYFSRATIPFCRDQPDRLPSPLLGWASRRCAISESPVTAWASCVNFRSCRRRRWKSRKRSSNCARCGTDTASRYTLPNRHPVPASIRQKTWNGCADCSVHRPEGMSGY